MTPRTSTQPKRLARAFALTALPVVLVLGLAASSCDEPKASIQESAQDQTQTVVGRLQAKVPAYEPTDSAERRNLNERLKRWESPNKIGYVALLANDGTLVWYGTIKGKPSSLNSHVTNDQDLRCPYGNSGAGCVAVPSPDLDGSWGDNPQGIFFFDTAGIYHEWSGPYFLSDAPSKLTQQPKLQVEANVGPTPNQGGTR